MVLVSVWTEGGRGSIVWTLSHVGVKVKVRFDVEYLCLVQASECKFAMAAILRCGGTAAYLRKRRN